MTEDQKAQKAMQLMGEMMECSVKLADKHKQHEAFSAMWELAVKDGDGVSETLYRGKIHDTMDLALDLRSHSLQLVKKIQSL